MHQVRVKDINRICRDTIFVETSKIKNVWECIYDTIDLYGIYGAKIGYLTQIGIVKEIIPKKVILKLKFDR